MSTANDGYRYGYSQMTDTWYRVTDWEYAGDGKIVAKSKTKVPKEEVPADWLTATLRRTENTGESDQ